MINRNFECLKRSTRQIANELGMSPTTANKYIKDALFEKSFEIPSFYAICKKENKYRKHGKIPQKACIRYKIKLSIYHLIKLCIKNFQKLYILEKQYFAQKNAKESKRITGSAILEYNRQVLNDILSDKSYLPNFQRNMLKSHKSVKYAAVMDIYYKRFLDDISILTTLGIDGSVTANPDEFAKTIASLEEIIWLFTLKRTICRDTDDSSQFNINNALHDVICHIDSYQDKKDDNYNEKTETISEESYKEQSKKLESEYFERVKQHLIEKLGKNINLDKDTCNFYNALKEREVFDDAYQIEYINFFYTYITTDDKLIAMKKLLWNCTDIYGRLFIPIHIKEADNILNILSNLISLIKTNYNINISDISPTDIIMLRCHFIYMKKTADVYNYYTESYDEKTQTYKSTAYEDDVLKEITDEDMRKKHISVVCKFSSFLCGKKPEIAISGTETDIIDSYFKQCIFIHTCSTYFKEIEVAKNTFKNTKENLSLTELYKNIQNNIDASIAIKWADSIFENTK